MSLDQLPTSELYRPRKAIGGDVYSAEQADLVAQVAAQAKALDGYRITDQRIFVLTAVRPDIGPQWVVLRAELGNKILDNLHGKEISRSVRANGPAAMSVWKLPNGAVVAIAQSRDLPDGSALVGYFTLET